jgi:hypothetical protein
MSKYGRNLLTIVGVSLVVFGLALILLPFITQTSRYVIAPGVPIVLVGVVLVVLAAYEEASGGVWIILGLRIEFGQALRDDEAQADAERRSRPRFRVTRERRRRRGTSQADG